VVTVVWSALLKIWQSVLPNEKRIAISLRAGAEESGAARRKSSSVRRERWSTGSIRQTRVTALQLLEGIRVWPMRSILARRPPATLGTCSTRSTTLRPALRTTGKRHSNLGVISQPRRDHRVPLVTSTISKSDSHRVARAGMTTNQSSAEAKGRSFTGLRTCSAGEKAICDLEVSAWRPIPTAQGSAWGDDTKGW
jgi:hypothetical protein